MVPATRTIELTLIEEAGDWRKHLPDPQMLAETIIQLLEIEGEVSLVLADNDYVQNLNRTYRQKDKPTNILSFESDQEDYLGDMIMAYETILVESIEQDKSFQDHFTHLLLHGMLHLLGYDHEDEQEANIMESKEITLLAKLGIANPYETR